MSKRITPKFLTSTLTEAAVNLVIRGVLYNPLLNAVAKEHRVGYIVVLAPSIDATTLRFTPSAASRPSIEPVCIFEQGFGERQRWTNDYDDIAHSKAIQLWHGQNVDGNCDVMPHLLFPGDTPFWGGVFRHGIVVAFSGDKPYIDQMISGMVADTIKAFAQLHFAESEEKKLKQAFLK